ncbi:Mitogen-activated protein kinase 7, partial [Mucuna pruriens]
MELNRLTMADVAEVLRIANGKHYYTIWQTLFEIDAKYVPIKPIGRGSSSVVCSSINRETNEKVAIRKIGNISENFVDALRTLRELKLLRDIRNKNVIALKDLLRGHKYLHYANTLHRDLKPGNLPINANYEKN